MPGSQPRRDSNATAQQAAAPSKRKRPRAMLLMTTGCSPRSDHQQNSRLSSRPRHRGRPRCACLAWAVRPYTARVTRPRSPSLADRPPFAGRAPNGRNPRTPGPFDGKPLLRPRPETPCGAKDKHLRAPPGRGTIFRLFPPDGERLPASQPPLAATRRREPHGLSGLPCESAQMGGRDANQTAL